MTLNDLIGTGATSNTEEKVFEASYSVANSDHVPFIFRSSEAFTGSDEYIEILTTLANNDINVSCLVEDLSYVAEARAHYNEMQTSRLIDLASGN